MPFHNYLTRSEYAQADGAEQTMWYPISDTGFETDRKIWLEAQKLNDAIEKERKIRDDAETQLQKEIAKKREIWLDAQREKAQKFNDAIEKERKIRDDAEKQLQKEIAKEGKIWLERGAAAYALSKTITQAAFPRKQAAAVDRSDVPSGLLNDGPFSDPSSKRPQGPLVVNPKKQGTSSARPDQPTPWYKSFWGVVFTHAVLPVHLVLATAVSIVLFRRTTLSSKSKLMHMAINFLGVLIAPIGYLYSMLTVPASSGQVA